MYETPSIDNNVFSVAFLLIGELRYHKNLIVSKFFYLEKNHPIREWSCWTVDVNHQLVKSLAGSWATPDVSAWKWWDQWWSDHSVKQSTWINRGYYLWCYQPLILNSWGILDLKPICKPSPSESEVFCVWGVLPSLKLTSHLKKEGWKTTFLLGRPDFQELCQFQGT